MSLLDCRLPARWIVLAVLSLTWGNAPPARAQEALGAGIAENIAAGRSATDFNSRVRVRTGYLSLPRDTEIVPTQFSGTYAPSPSVALRLQVPLVYADPGNARSEFGLSDMSARVLWRPWTHSKGAAAFVGVEFLLPTASDPVLGTEKYSVAPLAALFLPLRENVFFLAIYQQLISFAGRDSRADLNILRLRPVLLAQWPRGWWTLLDVGFLWDLEDDRPTDDTMTLAIEVGKQLTERVALSGKPSVKVYGSEDFAWAFELSLTYRFD